MPRNVFDNEDSKKGNDPIRKSVSIPLKSGEAVIGGLIVFEDGTVEGDIRVNELTKNLHELAENGIAIKAEPAHDPWGSSAEDIRKRHQV